MAGQSRDAQVRLGLIGCAVRALSWETLGVSIRWRSFFGDTYPYNASDLARLACYRIGLSRDFGSFVITTATLAITRDRPD
jgi:hypothetical protein